MVNPQNTDKLLSRLQQVYFDADDNLRNRFDRSLPFQDSIFDRWVRAESLGFSRGASIYNSASVFGKVSVGFSTWIGPNTILDGSGGEIRIGSFCSISAGVHIYTHDTVLWALSGGKCTRNVNPVTIADNVYIGSQSIITPGVSVGNKSVIGANSFVNRDVKESSIVAGSPAREIGHVVGEGEKIRLEYFPR